MHKVQQRLSRVLITNCKGGDIDIRGDADGDVDVDDEDISSHAKGVLVAMMVLIFARRR
jgi:hypothetical protein